MFRRALDNRELKFSAGRVAEEISQEKFFPLFRPADGK